MRYLNDNRDENRNGNRYFAEYELVDNPSARIPVCLCLDISGSMSGDPISELNDGVRLFYDAINSDETARYSADISVVTFGDTARKQCDFSGVGSQKVPSFSAYGGTPMAEAVDMALDMLQARKAEYSSKGVDYFQPWLVLMTDGCPTSRDSDVDKASKRCSELVRDRKLTIFPIGIGKGADMETLGRFSPNRSPLRLQGLKFSEFFAWLSRSISSTSQSTPGDSVRLDMEGIKGWATLD